MTNTKILNSDVFYNEESNKLTEPFVKYPTMTGRIKWERLPKEQAIALIEPKFKEKKKIISINWMYRVK